MKRIYNRFYRYYKKQGIINLLKRVIEIIYRNLFKNKFVLYYTDLTELEETKFGNEKFSIVKFNIKDTLPPEYIDTLFHFRDKNIFNKNMEERFEKGATLWCIIFDNAFSGFVWSIVQYPMEKYFFPLTSNDVHLFDNEIFENYRGKGINKYLISYVLHEFKNMGFTKAYIETAVWNIPEMRSLAKTPFDRLANIKKRNLFGRTFTIWDEN